MANRFKTKALPLQAQGIGLEKLFPESQVRYERGSMTWEAVITPSPLSQKYNVRMFYKLGDSPKVNVVEPELIVPEGKRLPHVYPGERLCLYLPKIGEWTKDKLLSITVVPWISEWLLHYEIWLSTGEWCGGGIHPLGKKKSY